MSEISRAERVSRSESLRVFLNRRSFFDPDSINLLRERENWKFLKKATVEKRFGKGGDEKSNRIARYVFRLNDSTLPYACIRKRNSKIFSLVVAELRRYFYSIHIRCSTRFLRSAMSNCTGGEGVVIVILRESSAGIRGCGFLKLPATIAAID